MALLEVTLGSMLFGPCSGCFASFGRINLVEQLGSNMLHHVSQGCVGHGPIHLLVESAELIDLHWVADFDG